MKEATFMESRTNVSLLLVAWLAVSGLALAQADRGIINGTITDSTGASVPEARVSATNAATGVAFATKSTSSGDFSIPALPVGLYQLRAEKTGFKAAVRADVIVSAGGTVTINVQLEVGAVTESVSVAATLELLQTSTAKVSTAVSPHRGVGGRPRSGGRHAKPC